LKLQVDSQFKPLTADLWQEVNAHARTNAMERRELPLAGSRSEPQLTTSDFGNLKNQLFRLSSLAPL
jgi:hypothetical protein